MTSDLANSRHSPLSEAEQATWIQYQRLRARLASRLGRELARAGLSEAEFEVMLALGATGESVRALALRCGLDWEKSRLSHQLRRMEARGLIARSTCAEDGRSIVIHLTAAGREKLAAATVLHHTAVAELVMAALTPDQLAAFAAIADAVLARLDAADSVNDRASEHGVLVHGAR